MSISTTSLESGALKIFVDGSLNVLTAVDFRRTLDKMTGFDTFIPITPAEVAAAAGRSKSRRELRRQLKDMS